VMSAHREGFADFIVAAGGSEQTAVIARVRDDGQLIKQLDLTPLAHIDISLGGLGSDGNLYLIDNRFPSVNIYRMNPLTGELLDDPTAPFTGSDKVPGLFGIHRMAFGPNGDLFVLGNAGVDPGGSGFGVSVVHRIDSVTGLSESSYSEVEPYGFSDIAVRPVSAGQLDDVEVFITEGYGSLTHWLSSETGNSAAQSLGIGQSFARSMELGPDGKLYFRTDSNQIWRYDLETDAGTTFIDSIPDPFTGSAVSLGGDVAFGVDNDMFLIREGTIGSSFNWQSAVYRFDGTSGGLLGEALTQLPEYLIPTGTLVYLPAPEPAALGLIASGLMASLWRVRKR